MHSHAHDHHHHHAPTSLSRALLLGAGINLLYVVVEFGLGFYYNSLALIADAGHNLSDVASLLLSLLAFRLAQVRTTATFTYGFRKSTVLASLINAVLLLVAVGAIAWESIGRLTNPEPVPGGPVAWVAALGILVNGFSAGLFHRDQEHDLNIKGAYLHLLADALVSLGVVISGLLIRYTGWYWLDAVTGIIVALVILGSTWRLLSDSVRLSLDGVPANVDLSDVKKHIKAVTGVRDVHHVHVWAMSTTENALTAHLVLEPALTDKQVSTLKNEVRHQLQHLRIEHATLEVETDANRCEDEAC